MHIETTSVVSLHYQNGSNRGNGFGFKTDEDLAMASADITVGM